MASSNLGRVQGGGMFGSTSTSTSSIPKTTVKTAGGVSPLVGDTIVNANGDLCEVTSITSSEFSVRKYGNITKDFSDVSFASSSWDRIMEVILAGKAAEVFKLSDTRTIWLTNGKEVTLNILDLTGRHDIISKEDDVNNDDISLDSYEGPAPCGFAPITFGILEPIYDEYTACEYGNGEWWGSLRDKMREYVDLLPDEIKESIVPVIKRTYAVGRGKMVKTPEKCFPLSLSEIVGNKFWDSFSSGEVDLQSYNAGPLASEGEQYEFFRTVKDGERAEDRACWRLEEIGGDAYWLRTADETSGGNRAYAILYDGTITVQDQGYTCSVVSFAFCVGKR